MSDFSFFFMKSKQLQNLRKQLIKFISMGVYLNDGFMEVILTYNHDKYV